MRARLIDWITAGLAGLLVVLVLVQPGAPRPGDLDLQVRAEPGTEAGSFVVTVRWHWQRRPGPWFGRSMDDLGLVFDQDRAFAIQPDRWTHSDLAEVVLAAGERLPSRQDSITAGEDGEYRYVLRWKDQTVTDRWPLPVRLQYIHGAEGIGTLTDRGWVKAVDFTLPPPAQPGS